jgi:FkbM family methyltransferase
MKNLSRQLSTAEQIARNIITDESNRNERALRLLRFLGWQVWKRSICKPVRVRLFNGQRFCAYPNDDISSAAIYFRIPDYREISFLRSKLNGGTLLDVGANVGLVSLLLADRIDHSVLFEPNLLALERARENLSMNKLSFKLVPLAVSDTVGPVFLEDRGGVATTNRTVSEGMATVWPVIKVKSISLDAYLRSVSLSWPVTVVKIDVEGHENSVLKGMQACLEEFRPIIVFEYLERLNLQEARSLLGKHRYEVLMLGADCSVHILPERPPPLQNLVALPK